MLAETPDFAVWLAGDPDEQRHPRALLAQAVEATLDADETLGLLVEGTRLTRTEVDQGGDGDTPVLAARLSFEVSYWTRVVETPEGALPLQALYSWAPRIGVLHESEYQPLLDPAGATP